MTNCITLAALVLALPLCCTEPLFPLSSTKVFETDFIESFNVSNSSSPLCLFSEGRFVASDGEFIQEEGLMTQRIEPFTLTHPPSETGYLDHYKWLLHTRAVEVGTHQRLRYTARLSSYTSHTSQHPFGSAVTDSDHDPRLASCGATMFDLHTGLSATLLLTNHSVWALYARLPHKDPVSYLSFAYMKRVGERDPDEVHDLAFEYRRAKGSLAFIVDDKVRWLVKDLGLPLVGEEDVRVVALGSGSPSLAQPSGYTVGMICLSLLDFSDPLSNSTVGLVRLEPNSTNILPENYVDELGLETSRIFGQGASLTAHHLNVERATEMSAWLGDSIVFLTLGTVLGSLVLGCVLMWACRPSKEGQHVLLEERGK